MSSPTRSRPQTSQLQEQPKSRSQTAPHLEYSVSSNTSRHVPQREASPNSRGFKDQLDMPWLPRSVLKKGLSMRMDTMGNDILAQVRAEVTGAIQDVFRDFMSHLDERNKVSDQKLQDFSSKLDIVQMTAEQARDGLNNIDLSVVMDELQGNAVVQASAAKTLEEQLTEISSKLEKLATNVESHAETEQGKMEQIATTTHASWRLAESIQQQQISALHTAQDVQKMSKQLLSQHAAVDSKLSHLSVLTRALPVKQDVSAVANQVKRSEDVLNLDFQMMLSEVAKIQKGLHLEYIEHTDFTSRQARAEDGERETRPPAEQAPDSPISTEPPRGGFWDDEEGDGEDDLEDIQEGALGLRVRKRVRDIFAQTEHATFANAANQTDPRITERKKEKKAAAKPKPKPQPPKENKAVFADADAMKAKARAKLVKPQYSVFDYYHDKGWAQRIARNQWFENITLLVVSLNSIWMAIDTDHNDQVLIQDMNPVFLTGEMLFCTYFTVELVIRFCAFAKKRSCLRDAWFVFDSVLVSLMILETWILPILTFISPGLDQALRGLNLGTLRLVRMVKILRLSRMAKLLKAFPELQIIIRGLRFAFRSVGVFLILWIVLIFVYAILLTQLNSSLETSEAFSTLFSKVDISMETLFYYGVLPQQASLLRTAMQSNKICAFLILVFLVVASITITYMLVGVLVEMMSAISAMEKEGMTVSFLATQLREQMEAMSKKTDQAMSKQELIQLLQEPEITRIVSGVGVDIGTMLDMMDVIYEDLDKKGITGVSFESLVELILNLRGANHATVRDVKELLRVLKSIFNEKLSSMQASLQEDLDHLRSELGDRMEGAFDRDVSRDDEDD